MKDETKVSDEITPSRETYAKLNANHSGPHCQGQTSQEAQAALDEIDRLRDDVAKLLTRCILLDEEVAELRAGLVEMTKWVQRNDPASYPEAADRFHHCVNQHEWWGPAFPTCPICHAERSES